MGVAEHAIGHTEFAPPPLTEEFTVLLNFYSDVKNLLDGVLEAVEVVVDQSCEGQTEDGVKRLKILYETSKLQHEAELK